MLILGSMDFTPSEKLKLFFATSNPSFFKKGDVVLRIGDELMASYYVKKGLIKDSSISFEGHEFTLFIFKPEDIFSYNWIFNQIPNEHIFRALTDCVIYQKSREGLLLFLEQNPDVMLMITQKIVIRLRGLTQRMEHLAYGTARQKVSSIINILSERFGKQNEKGVTISMKLTQQDISELIGLSRETTSIEINKLREEKILSLASGYYTILNLKVLQKNIAIFN